MALSILIFILINAPEKIFDRSQKRCDYKIINIRLISALPNFRPRSLGANKPISVQKFYLVPFINVFFNLLHLLNEISGFKQSCFSSV